MMVVMVMMVVAGMVVVGPVAWQPTCMGAAGISRKGRGTDGCGMGVFYAAVHRLDRGAGLAVAGSVELVASGSRWDGDTVTESLDP